MKIRISTAAGETLALMDVLDLFRARAYWGQGAEALPRPKTVLRIEAIAESDGAYVRQGDARDGARLTLQEFQVVKEPCSE